MGTPSWLAEPLSWVGMRWPDADPARLFVMSDDWVKFGQGVESKMWNLERSTEDVQTLNDGAAAAGFHAWFDKPGGPGENLRDTALSSAEIGAALRAMGTQAVAMQALFVAELALLATGVAAIGKAVATGAVLAAAGQTARQAIIRRVRGALSAAMLRAAGAAMVGGSVISLLACAEQRLEQIGPRLAGASRAELDLLVTERATADSILANSGMRGRITDFRTALAGATSLPEAQKLILEHGQQLWRAAADRVQSGVAGNRPELTDDRPLYWARLEMAAAIRDWQPSFSMSATDRDTLTQDLDRASRGMTSDRFPPGVRRIFVTGFDPFQLDVDPRTGNPSGAVALGLDGKRIIVDGVEYGFEAAMLPVRFGDFDAGLANDLFGPKMSGAEKADLILTVSLDANRPEYQLEHFYSDRSGHFADNAGRNRLDGPIPGLSVPGMLESTLPENKMLRAATTYGGVVPDDSMGSGLAARGSGGNYLSNEVPRRVAELRDQTAPSLPTGHLHIPAPNSSRARLDIIRDVEAIIRAGVAP